MDALQQLEQLVKHFPPLPIRSVNTDHPEHTVYKYVGMPYGGLLYGKFDLHKTFFSPRTDIGPLQRSVDVMFDHGLLPGIDFEILGRATILDEVTDEGRLFEIIVKKSHKYHNLIYRLYKEGILYGSPQAIASSYKEDPDTGELLRFIPAEWSFTVNPSNLLAKPVSAVRSVFTDNNISENDFDTWYRNRGFITMDNNLQTPPAAAPVTPVTPVETTLTPAPADASTLASRVQEVVARSQDVAPAEENDPLARNLQQVATVLRSIYDTMEAVRTAQTASQTAAQTQEAANTAALARLEQRLTDIENGIVAATQANVELVGRAIREQTITNLLTVSQDERNILARRVQDQNTLGAPVVPANQPAASDVSRTTVKVRPPMPGA